MGVDLVFTPLLRNLFVATGLIRILYGFFPSSVLASDSTHRKNLKEVEK